MPFVNGQPGTQDWSNKFRSAGQPNRSSRVKPSGQAGSSDMERRTAGMLCAVPGRTDKKSIAIIFKKWRAPKRDTTQNACKTTKHFPMQAFQLFCQHCGATPPAGLHCDVEKTSKHTFVHAQAIGTCVHRVCVCFHRCRRELPLVLLPCPSCFLVGLCRVLVSFYRRRHFHPTRDPRSFWFRPPLFSFSLDADFP